MRQAEPRGFTLVEVLAALLLGGVVVSLSAAISVQAAKSHQAARAMVAVRWERLRMMDRFEEDARSALSEFPDTGAAIRVNPAPGRLLEITALAEVPARDALFRERLPAIVAYLAEDNPDGREGKQLVREVKSLVAPQAETFREVLAGDLVEAVVEAFYENRWAQQRPGQAKDSDPRALRLTGRFQNGVGALRRTVVLSDEPRTK